MYQAYVDVVSTDGSGDKLPSIGDQIHVHAVADGESSLDRVIFGVLVELHTSDTRDLDCLLQRDDDGMIPTAVFDISLSDSDDDGE